MASKNLPMRHPISTLLRNPLKQRNLTPVRKIHTDTPATATAPPQNHRPRDVSWAIDLSMRLPRVYPILDTESLEARGISLETAAAAFLEGGAGILQIRHKGHWSRDFFEAAKRVARLCREDGADLIVNDRADFALLLEAGLHVGQDDLLPARCPQADGARCRDRLLQPQRQPTLRGRRRTRGLRGARPGLPHRFQAQSRPGGGGRRGSAAAARFWTSRWWPSAASRAKTPCDVLDAGADSVAVIAGLLPEAATAQSLRQRMEEWQQLVKTI